jgi:hypothetical protein
MNLRKQEIFLIGSQGGQLDDMTHAGHLCRFNCV